MLSASNVLQFPQIDIICVRARALSFYLIDMHTQLRGSVILTSASGVEGVGSTDIRLKNVRIVVHSPPRMPQASFRFAHA